MGMWSWEGINKEGRKASGKVSARSSKEVRKLLRAQGVKPQKISAPSLLEFDLGEWMVESGLAKAFGAKELCYFTKQLAIMINAGVPIMQSLDILYKQEKNPSLKKSLRQIAKSVGEGKTLADSMKEQKGFSKLYCNLVKAGETGGILDIILDKLATHMEKQERTKSQIKSAMMYPAIVVVVGLAVVYGMMVFVVPQFQSMLTDTGQETPWITQFVINISEFLQANTIYMVPGFILFILILKAYIKTPTGKPVFDKLMMKMPVFGGIVLKGNLNSFSRTLATMISSGVSLVDALDVCIETIDNTVIANDIKKVRKAVVEGKTLTEPLSQIEYFPPMVCQMIKVGEQTGIMDEMLNKISTVFEGEVDDLVAGMTKMIEPIILVVLGGIVAVILVAMYMPIFMSAGGAD